MIIKSVRLRNFGVFEDHTVDFSPQMNLIVGKMGSGKSTIIRAIKLGLTGEYFGNKDENVRQNKNDTDKSFIELQLSHEGFDIYVKRNVCSSGVTLKVDGEKRGRNVEEVNSILWDLLDTDKDKISNYLFADQECIKGVLDMRPSDRKNALLKLFGVTKAAAVYKQLGDYLGKLDTPTSLVDVNALETEISELEVSIAAIDAELTTLDYDDSFVAKRLKELQTVIDAISVQRKFVPLKEAKAAELTLCEDSIVDLRDKVVSKESEIESVKESLEAAVDDAAEARSAVAAWNLIKANKDKVDSLKKEKLAIYDSFDDLAPPRHAPITEDECSVLDTRKSELAAYKNELLKYHDITNKDACPACGLPGGDIESRASFLREQIQSVEPQVVLDDARRIAWREYDASREAHERELEVVCESLSLLSAAKEPSMAWDTANDIVKSVDSVKSCLANLVQDLSLTEASLTGAAELAGKLERELAVYTKELAGSITYDVDSANAVVQERDGLLAAKTAHVKLCVDRAKLGERLDAGRLRLHDHQAVLAQAQRVHDKKAYLEQIRNVFHYDNVPRMVSYRYLEHLQDKINDVLSLFAAPFSVAPDDSLGFTATFFDGSRTHSADRLSVGQKIILAISFRVAVNSTFAGSLSVLSMDEPTPGLHEEELDRLPEVFEPLRNVAQAQGLQIIVVTHEPRIEHLFDKVIEVACV